MSGAERSAEQAVLAERLTSPEMVETVARAIQDQQVEGRVEYRRRVGYQGRLSLARAALDAVCVELGLPDSLDLFSRPGAGEPS